jgi:hypothetical protein
MRAGPNNEAREGGFCPALKPLYRRRPTFKSESCISEQASPLLRGFKAKAALDLFDAGSSAVYFVGDPEKIADNVKVYRDEAELSALILSARPLIEEAETISPLLLPRLDEIP